jgi:DNA-binding transcriptional LysR family regulator
MSRLALRYILQCRVSNGAIQMLNAALAGLGLAYIPEEMAEPYFTKGRLKRVLADWCQPLRWETGYDPSAAGELGPIRWRPKWPVRGLTRART